MVYKIKMCTDSFNDRWKIVGKANSLADARVKARLMLEKGIPSRKKELSVHVVIDGRTNKSAIGFVVKSGNTYYWIDYRGRYRQFCEDGMLLD